MIFEFLIAILAYCANHCLTQFKKALTVQPGFRIAVRKSFGFR